MRIPNLGLQTVLRERGLDPAHEIAAICLVVSMLELAAAALREMAARRLLMMRSGRERSIVEQRIAGDSERHVASARSHAIAARGDSNDQFSA